MPLCIPSHMHDMGHVQPTWRDVCYHFHVPAESISTHLAEFIHFTDGSFQGSGRPALCPFCGPLCSGWLLKRCRRAHSFVWASSINNMTSGKLTEALEVFDKEENGSANRTQGWNNTGRVTRLSPPPMRPYFMFSLHFIHFSDQPNTSLSKQTLLLSHTHLFIHNYNTYLLTRLLCTIQTL